MVVPTCIEWHVLHGSSMVRCVVPADNDAAAPLCEAQRKHLAINVILICKQLVQDGWGAATWWTNAHDPIRLLRVEQPVLILMASHADADRWVSLYRVPESDHVLEVPARDRGSLCVSLVIAAMAFPARAVAACTARGPLPRGASIEVEVWVDVLPAVLAAAAGKSRHAAARVDDDAHSLRRRADEKIDVVVGEGIDVPVDPRGLDVVHGVVETTAPLSPLKQQQECDASSQAVGLARQRRGEAPRHCFCGP
mmetsp:Transcript_9708/g.24191  ORF Transcript_9708/g.24191 Transcript_9708/m.24191 type:complete len:252 (+) Transcript_9708:190-945(+)